MIWPFKSRKKLTAAEAAGIIERFLEERSLYPQEWNDFVESTSGDEQVEPYRKRLDELDPLVNRPGDPDPSALEEVRSILSKLRQLSR